MHTFAFVRDGNVKIKNVERSVTVVTGDGHIGIDANDIVSAANSRGDLNVISGFGNITVIIPRGADGLFNGLALFGQISTAFGLLGERSEISLFSMNQRTSLETGMSQVLLRVGDNATLY